MISVHVTVLSFDSVNTMKMQVELSVEVKFIWVDQRLVFSGLQDFEGDLNTTKDIPTEHTKPIWLPMDYIIYDNALIGKVHKSPIQYVQVIFACFLPCLNDKFCHPASQQMMVYYFHAFQQPSSFSFTQVRNDQAPMAARINTSDEVLLYRGNSLVLTRRLRITYRQFLLISNVFSSEYVRLVLLCFFTLNGI